MAKILRSYTLTEEAVEKLEQLSESYGLPLNGVLELLIHNGNMKADFNDEINLLRTRQNELLNRLENPLYLDKDKIWQEIYTVSEEIRSNRELQIEKLKLENEVISENQFRVFITKLTEIFKNNVKKEETFLNICRQIDEIIL